MNLSPAFGHPDLRKQVQDLQTLAKIVQMKGGWTGRWGYWTGHIRTWTSKDWCWMRIILKGQTRTETQWQLFHFLCIYFHQRSRISKGFQRHRCCFIIGCTLRPSVECPGRPAILGTRKGALDPDAQIALAGAYPGGIGAFGDDIHILSQNLYNRFNTGASLIMFYLLLCCRCYSQCTHVYLA